MRKCKSCESHMVAILKAGEAGELRELVAGLLSGCWRAWRRLEPESAAKCACFFGGATRTATSHSAIEQRAPVS